MAKTYVHLETYEKDQERNTVITSSSQIEVDTSARNASITDIGSIDEGDTVERSKNRQETPIDFAHRLAYRTRVVSRVRVLAVRDDLPVVRSFGVRSVVR